MPSKPLEERFWAKVQKTPTCWLWTGCCAESGYGQIRADGRTRRVHRVAYELLVGPIPPGLTIDHVKTRGCTHPNCVNPDHLEPVTQRENNRRSDTGMSTIYAARTHCDHGHEFTSENTGTNGRGNRACRACERERCRRAYRARKAARALREVGDRP